jgi:phage tail-like protein
MAQFTVNPTRSDPYKNFKFRVLWEGRIIEGVSKVSALRRSTETVGYREGGAISRRSVSPGKTQFDPITLERGITHDTAFEEWANQIYNTLGDEGVSLKDLRKDIRIELYNLSGQLVIAYMVFRCWVSEYQALPELDAVGEASTAFERIVLHHDGWVRDQSIAEPVEI